MAGDSSSSVDNVKKEPEKNASDLESIDHCSEDDSSVKEQPPTNKDGTETAKSDDDSKGYDTRSEVASSATSDDSDSGDSASSCRSFDLKRKRHCKTLPSSSSPRLSSPPNSHAASGRPNDSPPPPKRNSAEYVGRLNCLFRNARFFVIKSNNAENIALSKAKGVWATLPQNRIKLSEAFRRCENVILVFSAKESGKFSGFARLATAVDRAISPVPWMVPAQLTANLLEGTFRIDWICRNELPFSFTASLRNPWNRNKPVKIARDGQEVEPRVAEKLCRLFAEDETVDLATVLRKSKEAAKMRAAAAPKRPPDVAGQALFTAKYRVKMLQQQHRQPQYSHYHKNDNSEDGRGGRKPFPFPHRLHHDGRGGGRVITSIETYVKRFGHPFGPPMPPPPGMGIPFMMPPPPPPPPGSVMFSSQFGHVPTTPFPQPQLPPPSRYYEPVPPLPPPRSAFAHFSKMNPLHAAAVASKHIMYDRSVEQQHFLRKTREKELCTQKENRSKRKGAESRKGRTTHHREKR